MRQFIGASNPVQRPGPNGGVSESQIGPNRYEIDVRVNGYTSRGTALEYAHRRASELCPDGYNPIDTSQGQSDYYVQYGRTVHNMPKAQVGLIVECKTASTVVHDGAGASSANAERKSVIGDKPLYCSNRAGAPNEGSCYLSQEACGRFRDNANARADSETKFDICVESKAGACFNYTTVLSEEHGFVCTPSISNCEAQLTTFRTNPDYKVIMKQCGVYRVRAASAGSSQAASGD